MQMQTEKKTRSRHAMLVAGLPKLVFSLFHFYVKAEFNAEGASATTAPKCTKPKCTKARADVAAEPTPIATACSHQFH